MMIKETGCFFLGEGRFALCDMAFDSPAPGQVLVRNMASGVCGTDVHIAAGEKGSAEVAPPVVLGHEYAGVVLAVGAGVDNVAAGDCVAIDPNIYCGRCRFCRNGQKQFCQHLSAIGVNRDGGFARVSLVPQTQVFRMNADVGFEAMAMVEPVACCLRGVRQADVRAGDVTLVIGGGAIGQIMAQLLRLAGASRVVVSEPVPMRRDIALALGADGALDPAVGDVRAQFAALTGRAGADVVVECVGGAATSRQAVDMADKGGRVVLFGVPAPDAAMPLPLFDVFKKELQIRGSFINPDTHEAAAALLNAGKLNVRPLITHRFALEDTPLAIATQREAASIKVMVLPNGNPP